MIEVENLKKQFGSVQAVNGVTFTTTGSGYTATAEGTIVAQRPFDIQEMPPTQPYIYQFPLGQEPKCIVGNSVRIMVKAAATVNAICWIEFEI